MSPAPLPALPPTRRAGPGTGAAPRLHLDPIGGMAGDMFLAACLDLGVPLGVVEDALAALGLREVSVEAWRDARGTGDPQPGTRFRVLVDGESLEDDGTAVPAADWDLLGLLGLLRAGALPVSVRKRAARMFRRLALAWGRSRGVPITAVRFAGGPGLDFLVDLVGASAVVEHLRHHRILGSADGEPSLRITCGPVFLGGPVPGGSEVPPPLVQAILRTLAQPPPLAWWGRRAGAGQCLTPTGAVLLAELVDEWTVEVPTLDGAAREGWGLGAKELDDRPNGLRVRWLP